MFDNIGAQGKGAAVVHGHLVWEDGPSSKRVDNVIVSRSERMGDVVVAADREGGSTIGEWLMTLLLWRILNRAEVEDMGERDHLIERKADKGTRLLPVGKVVAVGKGGVHGDLVITTCRFA